MAWTPSGGKNLGFGKRNREKLTSRVTPGNAAWVRATAAAWGITHGQVIDIALVRLREDIEEQSGMIGKLRVAVEALRRGE